MPDERPGWCGVLEIARLPKPPEAHRHAEVECLLVLRGHARQLIDDRIIDLAPGSMVWLFPGQEHALVDWSPDLVIALLVVQPDFVREVLRAPSAAVLLEPDPPGTFHRRVVGGRAAEFEQQVRRWNTALCADRADLQDWLDAALRLVLAGAWQAYSETAPLPDRAVHPAVERAAHHLRLRGDLALPALAQLVGLSPARLSRVFAREMGCTLGDYRTRLRLERFVALCRSGRGPLRDAARGAGFGSYAQCARSFQAHFGCGPAAWIGTADLAEAVG